MKPAARLCVCDLSAVSNEELAVRFKESDQHSALAELLTRYQHLIGRLVANSARASRLAQADRPDAEQVLRMVLHKIVSCYDAVQGDRSDRCCLHTRLAQALPARLLNIERDHRRAERRFDRSVAAARALERAIDPHDPALEVEAEEMAKRVRAVFNQLSTEDQLLWEGLAAGRSLRALALDWGVSPDSAERRRQRLRAKLEIRLGDLFP